jgi:hypothetical protein
MCYWRKAWERRPFDDISHGEDMRFQGRCKTLGYDSTHELIWADEELPPPVGQKKGYHFHGYVNNTAAPCEPRIICGIHGDRQSGNYELGKGSVWYRAEQWDKHCSEVMKL